MTASNVDVAFKKLIHEIYKLSKTNKIGSPHANEFDGMFCNYSTTNFESNKNSGKPSHNTSGHYHKQASHNLSGIKNSIVLSQASHKSII
jgi:hypothetical protein